MAKPNDEVKTQECVYGILKVCMKQNTNKKIDMNICQCCILSRIEQHLYGIAKKMYGPNDPNKFNR